MTDIYLVRHGVTAHTGHKLTGWAEGVSLTDEGRTQAKAAGELLADVPFKAIYSSPIDRTRETAEIIAKYHGLEVQTTKGIGEVQYGAWTNRSLKSLQRTKLWGQLLRWPSAVRFPEGDTLRDVQARAVGEVETLRQRHPKDAICCVSHADTIRTIVAYYMGLHIDFIHRFHVGPASVSVVRVGERPQVLSLNALPVEPFKR